MESNIASVATQDQVKITFNEICFSVQVPKGGAATQAGRGGAPSGKKGPFAKKEMQEKVILKGVSGVFKAGRLTAVMGASGAGKTSLLQVLAGEVRQGNLSGEILVNNEHASGALMKKVSGFVFQDDVILASMTVRECITMSAVLRLGKDIPMTEKLARVDATIKLLNLEKCADTIVGDSILKGISGGERKRTAMAMEMITNPAILFLDEPTSGLDTFTAYTVIRCLKDLTESGRTVIATIHQPSSDIFQMFDDLLLLADGRVMYAGPCNKMVDYFSRYNFSCPELSNPADFMFMAILNNEIELPNFSQKLNSDEKHETNQERISRLLDQWPASPENQVVLAETANIPSIGIPKKSYKVKSTWFTQFSYLLGRASKNAFRNPFIVRAKFIQTVFLSLIIGLLYRDLPSRDRVYNTQANIPLSLQWNLPPDGVQDRTGLLFFLAVNNMFGSAIGVLSIFGKEKLVYNREQGAGYYSLSSYFWSKLMVEVPFQILAPLLQAVIVYWLTGLQNWASSFFILFSLTMLCSLCGFALGIFFASIFRNIQSALIATPMCLLPLMLFSGLFQNQGSIPNYFNWIKYISPMKYGFEGLIKNEYNSRFLVYTLNGTAITGPQEVTNLGLDDGLDIWANALILVAMVIFLISTAYMALYRIQRASKPIPIKLKK